MINKSKFAARVCNITKEFLNADPAESELRKLILDDLENEFSLSMPKAENIAVNKLKIPPGGNIHDYYSQAPYWFPDPSKADGLPYINRDGEFNPDAISPESDHERMKRVTRAIYKLALLYFYRKDEKYASHASLMIKEWFLNPESKMNPHLHFGQAIPGICLGRDAGIIEVHTFIHIIDSLNLIETSSVLDSSLKNGMKNWFSAFLDWLMTDEIGIKESTAPNNHGIWYLALCLKLAAFCGRTELLPILAEKVIERISLQISKDGSLPLELKRTQPWDYSIFCLHAFFASASILKDSETADLFRYKNRDGNGIKEAVDFLVEVLKGREWTYREIYGLKKETILPILKMSSLFFNDKSYNELCKDLPLNDTDTSSLLLF